MSIFGVNESLGALLADDDKKAEAKYKEELAKHEALSTAEKKRIKQDHDARVAAEMQPHRLDYSDDEEGDV